MCLEKLINIAKPLCMNLDRKKKHVSIAFHKMRECVAAGITNPVKVDTKVNVADFMTKSLSWKELHFHSSCFFGRFNFGTEVDMKGVNSENLREL